MRGHVNPQAHMFSYFSPDMEAIFTEARATSCLKTTAAELANIDVPFTVEASGKFGLTIAEIRLTPNAQVARAPCPPSADSSMR
jgi:hypothetical protein